MHPENRIKPTDIRRDGFYAKYDAFSLSKIMKIRMFYGVIGKEVGNDEMLSYEICSPLVYAQKSE